MVYHCYRQMQVICWRLDHCTPFSSCQVYQWNSELLQLPCRFLKALQWQEAGLFLSQRGVIFQARSSDGFPDRWWSCSECPLPVGAWRTLQQDRLRCVFWHKNEEHEDVGIQIWRMWHKWKFSEQGGWGLRSFRACYGHGDCDEFLARSDFGSGNACMGLATCNYSKRLPSPAFPMLLPCCSC